MTSSPPTTSSLPATMKAIGLPTATGGVDLLEELTVPLPTLGPNDILVKLSAVGMNPVDCKARNGMGNPGPLEQPKILGYDGVGTVVKLGSDATLFEIGDEVWTAGVLTRNGTNAEYMAVDERIVGKAPSSVSPVQAAAVPLVLLTAWEGLFESLGLQAFAPENERKTILVLPGAGGVGSFVIQLAKKVLGLTVIATASRPESGAAAKGLGADHVVNHRETLKPQLQELNIQGGQVDYIFNAYKTDAYFDQYCDIIAPLGKIVSIVETDVPLDMTKLMAKRVTFVWELMFTRALFGVDPIRQHHILKTGARLVDSGLLQLPAIEEHTFTLENVKKAHTQQETGTVVGKQVFRVLDE